MEKDTAKFEYVKADVAKVEFAATTIAPGKNVKDLVKVTDKLGRDVTDEVEIEFESTNLSVIDTNGDVKSNTDNKSAIVVAKVKVGDGYVKSAPTTITVKDATATTFVGHYVYEDNAADNTDEFAKLDEDKKINYVYEDDYDTSNSPTKKLALYYKDQYGNSMKRATDVQITNLTPNIVIVEKGTDALNIKPIYPGEGYVKIKVGEVEHTIKIVVREKAKVATMELDKTDVSVVAGKAGEIVKVVFKDQFDNEIAPAEGLSAEVKDDKIAEATVAKDNKSITIEGLKEGATTVEVTYKDEDNKIDLKETINVTVVKAGELAKYEVVAKDTKLDVYAENKDKTPNSTTITVYEIDENGNKLGTVEFGENKAELVLVDKDGKELAANAEKVVDIKEDIKNTIEAQKAGTAYVQVKVGTLVIDTLEFEVVNTEPTPTTVEFIRNDLAYVGKLEGEEGKEEIKFYLPEATEASQLNNLTDDLKTIIKVKDQFGKEMENAADNLNNIVYTLTNAKGLTRTNELKGIDSVEEAKASVDVVITEIKLYNNNLIKEPVVVKVALDQTKALEDKKAAEEKALAKAALKTAIEEAKAKKEEGKEYKKDSLEAFNKLIEEAETALKAEDATVETLTKAKKALEEAKLEEKEERTEPTLNIKTEDGKTFTGLIVEGATVTVNNATVEDGEVTFNEEQNELKVTVTYEADDDNKAATFEITYTVTESEGTYTVTKTEAGK